MLFLDKLKSEIKNYDSFRAVCLVDEIRESINSGYVMTRIEESYYSELIDWLQLYSLKEAIKTPAN